MCRNWQLNFLTCFIFATCFWAGFVVVPQKVCAKLEEAAEISCLRLCFFYWSRTWFKGQHSNTIVFFCCEVFNMVTQCQTVPLSLYTVSWNSSDFVCCFDISVISCFMFTRDVCLHLFAILVAAFLHWWPVITSVNYKKMCAQLWVLIKRTALSGLNCWSK